MCLGGGNPGAAIAQQEAERQRLITQGLGSVNQAFAGFGPDFYNKMQQNYLAATVPQVGQQFRTTQNQLASTMSNHGLLRSSAAQNLGSSLQQQLATNLFNVGNQATQAVQGLQKQVGQEKSNVIAQLQQSANPTLAATQATESASQFAAPSLVQPLGNLFQNWSNTYLANRIGQLYAQPSPYTWDWARQQQGANAPASYGVK